MTDFTYLLDTNILSNLILDPVGSVAQRIEEKGEDTVCTNIVVACELRFGVEKKQSTSLQARVEELLTVLDVLALDVGIFLHYIFRYFQFAGKQPQFSFAFRLVDDKIYQRHVVTGLQVSILSLP